MLLDDLQIAIKKESDAYVINVLTFVLYRFL